MMRILWWTTRFWPDVGGVEVMGAALLAEMESRGHELAVVTGPQLSPDAEQAADGVRPPPGISIHRFPLLSPLAAADPAMLFEIRQEIETLISSFSPDLIHLHTLGPHAALCSWILERKTLPLLVTVQEAMLAELDLGTETLPGRLLRRADRVNCVSRFMADIVLEAVPEIASRCEVIPNSLPTPEPAPSELPFEPPVLLGLGRLVREKGFDLVLQALARILPTFPRTRLILTGDGPERGALEDLARSLKVAHAVTFAGALPPEGVPALLNQVTAAVVPSRCQEAFGLVALQAAQMGRPVIAARRGGLDEIVADRESGLLVEPGKPGSLADGMTAILEHPDFARRLGRQARRIAEKRFAWLQTVNRYHELYTRISKDDRT